MKRLEAGFPAKELDRIAKLDVRSIWLDGSRAAAEESRSIIVGNRAA